MHDLSLTALAEGLRNKTFSSVELTQHCLNRIKQFDGDLQSFITITPEQALAQAQQADALIADGQGGALTGIPMAHKDLFCTEGVKTTCGSNILNNFIAPYSATVVEKVNAAGMIMVGKTNMDEFAMGSTSESSAYGVTANPWDHNKVPGGSSGGSAAAVAAGLVPFATGTDTGGSIRQPASFTGISGIKPTYGRVSRWGMVAYASSFDQGGPMARSAEDLALSLNVMSGFDPKDSTSIERDNEDYTAHLHDSLEGLKVGIPVEYFAEGLDDQVAEQIQLAITELEKLGARIIEVSLPNKQLAVPAYYVLAPAEASSNLSRYDGVRFGHRVADPNDLEDLYKRSRAEGFGAEVQRRIMVGAYALSAGYYDAYYGKAMKVRRLIRDDFLKTFEEVDVLAAPVSPTVAWDIGGKVKDPVSMYLEDIYTIPVNLAGLPAMSMPVGSSQNLPVGMQLIGNYFSESKLLNIAHQYQQVTDWHTRMPAQYA